MISEHIFQSTGDIYYSANLINLIFILSAKAIWNFGLKAYTCGTLVNALIMLLICSFFKLNGENLKLTKIIQNFLKGLGILYLCNSAGLKLYSKWDAICLHCTEIFKRTEANIRTTSDVVVWSSKGGSVNSLAAFHSACTALIRLFWEPEQYCKV